MEKVMQIVGMSDPFTREHQMRVSILSVCIGKRMMLPSEQLENIRIAGLVHDIGKTTISLGLLEKTDRLNHDERNIVMKHPQAGFDMLERIELHPTIKQSVLQHHEKLNGSGYPNGLTDGQILMEAKIVSVADVVDAMAVHRPYNPTQGIDNALTEIAQKKGVYYDPKVVEICIEIFTIAQFYFNVDTATSDL